VEFAEMRNRAEMAAFRAEGPSYTLATVYEHFVGGLDGARVRELVEAEEQVELEVARPVVAVTDQVRSWIWQGDVVYFVSDTLHSPNFLHRLLDQVGIQVPVERVLVSNMFGAFKRRGRLFRRCKQEGALPREARWHFGNSKISDVWGARCAGMVGHWFCAGNPTRLEALLERMVENGVAGADVLAGAVRVVRLGAEQGSDSSVSFGQLLGVVAVAFLCWIVARCADARIHKIFLMGRDCWVLHQIVKCPEVACCFKGVEFAYLKGSRRAWAKAEGDEGTRLRCYLEDAGALVADPCAFVDLGWNGTLHETLCSVRESVGAPPAVGFYLGKDDAPFGRWSHARHGLLSPMDFPARLQGRIDPNVKFFLEAMFQAPEGSCVGYERRERRIEAVCAPVPPWGIQVESDVADAARVARRAFETEGRALVYMDPKPIIRGVLELFALAPTRDECEQWGRRQVETPGGGEELAPRPKWLELFNVGSGRHCLSRHPNEWSRGRVGRADLLLRTILHGVGFGRG
jgi:FMN phosphatase YigB (HAD superfamily)